MKFKQLLLAITFIVTGSISMTRPCTSATLSYTQSISGTTATLTAVHTGLASPSYRWTYGTSLIGTASTATYSISSTGSNNVCLTITQLYYDSSGFVLDSCTLTFCDTVGSSSTGSSSGCPSLKAVAYTSDTLCLSGNVNTATIGGSPTASGGTPGYSYSWSGNPLDVTFNNSNIANPTATAWGTHSIVYLTVTDSMGCVARDTVVIDTTCGRTLSVKNENNPIEFSIYPNPATDIINLKFKNLNSENLNYSILDISGKVVEKEQLRIDKRTINVSTLAKGCYILLLENELNQNFKPIRFIKN